MSLNDAAPTLPLHMQDDTHGRHTVTQRLTSCQGRADDRHRRYGADDCHRDIVPCCVELDKWVHLLAKRNGKGTGGTEDVAGKRASSRLVEMATIGAHSTPTLRRGLIRILVWPLHLALWSVGAGGSAGRADSVGLRTQRVSQEYCFPRGSCRGACRFEFSLTQVR